MNARFDDCPLSVSEPAGMEIVEPTDTVGAAPVKSMFPAGIATLNARIGA